MSYVVECIDVHKSYQQMGKVIVRALRGVNMKVAKGEVVAIVGPSGSGKTTLLNCIGTVDKPDRGEIIIDGIDITKLPEKKLVEIRRKKIGFVFQTFNLIPVLTVFENVEVPLIIAGVPREKRRERVMELLKLVGLEGRIDHRPSELSGGEQQRVAIARALANSPSLILADEPTGELDTKNTEIIVNLLKDCASKEGASVIIATHDIENVAKRCDRILHLRDGVIVKEEVVSK